MDKDTINAIINTDAKELFEKALTFKINGDYTKYAVHLTMAANKDYDLAIDECMKDYHNETLHLKQNFLQTISFYEATQDYGYSLNYLGYIYNGGHSVLKDTNKAKQLYELGLQKGNSTAMFNLGLDEKDKKKRRELYEMATKLGHTRAMNFLGKMYLEGCAEAGIDRDLTKAKELFESAMKYDRDNALKNLVELYSHDEIKKDVEYIINYFVNIGHTDKLKDIYKFDDCILNMITENNRLRNHIAESKKLISV